MHRLSLIHISEPTRPLYISYAVFCLKKKKKKNKVSYNLIQKLSQRYSGNCNILVTEGKEIKRDSVSSGAVSYTHLRAHETSLHLVCRLLLEKKKKKKQSQLQLNTKIVIAILRQLQHLSN
eukprot:TRINITY_DN25378_c0_g1_i1.p2 TRINITY_DN25378_c0_g1~~TRINITY_DN25378_c0_g1_i1.p2  ORF type:complete len:121 (+),score=23.05 TRINITY_DN25378_c0_g1_i1:470-832(+)